MGYRCYKLMQALFVAWTLHSFTVEKTGRRQNNDRWVGSQLQDLVKDIP